ncbi:MAG: hypothetical protein ABIO61_07845 [Thermomonas sp.]
MKLQLQGQNMRLRIDESELAHLLAGEAVTNQTQLGSTHGFSQVLTLGGQVMPTLVMREGDWHIALPHAEVAAYVEQLPCRHALAFEVAMDAGPPLDVGFEVDIRDSLQARGPRRRQASPD